MDTIDKYFDLFWTNPELINRIFSETIRTRDLYCDLFYQSAKSQTIILEDNNVSRASSSFDSGVGIRVVEDDRTGYSFTENLDEKLISGAAKSAAAIAKSSKKKKPLSVKYGHTAKNDFYPSSKLWEDVSLVDQIKFIRDINDTVFKKDRRVIKVQISLSYESSCILFAASDGTIAWDFQPLFSLRISCTAEYNSKRETNSYSISGRYGGEHLFKMDTDSIASEIVRRTVLLFDSVRPEPGEQEVVLAAGSSGILLHESIGHGLEADFNRKGISIFSDRINKKIAEPFVTIIDDATIPHSRGSVNVDDEGITGQKTILVEKGILKGFMHDRISAKHFKTEPTGNGRRESFRYPPLPRMRTTYMLPGPHTKDEIIKSIKKGILAESFTNGQVMIGAGDFTFYVKSGYLIENGRLTRPVKDINLIGNGPDVLSKITMVGDDLEIDNSTWTCGKDGQDVPVSLGHPTIKVSSITVGSAV